MFSVEELRLAQKYPFSSYARAVVKASNLSLENVSDEVISRASLMICSSLEEKSHRKETPSHKNFSHKGVLEQEILAFPVAKIILSFMKERSFVQAFSSMISKRVFSELESEKDELLFMLAKDLSLSFEPDEQDGFFASVKLSSFLSAGFRQDFMKLVNQRVFGGKVFLSRNEFCRLVSSLFEQRFLSEFPLDTKNAPKKFSSAASELSTDFFEKRSKKFEKISFGAVRPEFFPPCVEKLYSDIYGGKNLSHSERFALATLMLDIGMPEKDVINLYRMTPNFDEKMTTYQVSRLSGSAGKKIQSPGCSKMAEYNIRLPNCPCNESMYIKHPLQYYRKQFLSEKKRKN